VPSSQGSDGAFQSGALAPTRVMTSLHINACSPSGELIEATGHRYRFGPKDVCRKPALPSRATVQSEPLVDADFEATRFLENGNSGGRGKAKGTLGMCFCLPELLRV